MVARLGKGFSPTGASIARHWNVHPQVQRAGALRQRYADATHGGVQVIGAVVVIIRTPQQPVAIIITGSDQRIMPTGLRILFQNKYRASAVCDQRIALARPQLAQGGTHVFVRNELCRILGVECPCVDHLCAMGVDDLDGFASAQSNCPPPASGDCEKLGYFGHWLLSDQLTGQSNQVRLTRAS